MLSILDRHVLRQVSLPLLGALVIGLLMLLADRMVNLLDTTLGKKNSFAVVFEMLAYLVPHYLGTAIPAALFLGLLLGFGKMSANSETDAFMASGIGLHRMAMPVIVLGVVMSLLSLAIMGWLQPHARYAYRSVVFDVQNVDVFYLAEEGVFMQAGDRTFIIDSLDRGRNAFERALPGRLITPRCASSSASPSAPTRASPSCWRKATWTVSYTHLTLPTNREV